MALAFEVEWIHQFTVSIMSQTVYEVLLCILSHIITIGIGL